MRHITTGFIIGFWAIVLMLWLTALHGCAPQQQCYAIQGIIDGSNVAILFNNCTGKFELLPIPGMKVEPESMSSSPKRESPRQPGV